MLKSFLQNRWTWILLTLALLPRLFDLDAFLTSDENTNIFLAGSAVVKAFLEGDLRGTYWHFYPGVTMSWADALGLVGQWLWASVTGATSEPLTRFVDSDIRSLLVAVRLPYALLTALFVPIVYHLLRAWLDPARQNQAMHYLALTAALFIAFDPFFLAHSRVVHGDAPVAVFMVVSILAFFLYLREGGRKLLLFSAVTGSLAAMTKAPGQLMAPFIILAALGDWLLAVLRTGHTDWALAKRRLSDIVVWGSVAFVALFLLWPAMWVDPVGTLQQMLAETFGKVEEGHLVFFFGQPTIDPGPWFYSYVIPFRLTPLTLVGVILSLILLVTGLVGGSAISPLGSQRSLSVLTILVWLAVVLLLLSGNLSPKKQDRYLLPVFPFLDVLAAIGWFGLWQFAASRWQMKSQSMRLAVFGLVAVQLLSILPYHPYYLSYFNPLMGGLPRAVETTLVGWGEGMEQVAAYLNQKPDAESLYVATTPSQTLLPYFKGQGDNFYTNDVALRADYVVIYRAQQQRLAPSPEIVQHYLAQEAEKVIEIKGVPYAWIYPNTPLIFTEVPANATLLNIGFGEVMRLAGYRLETGPAEVAVELFWHALPPLADDVGPCEAVLVENQESTVCPRIDYTVSLRLLNSTGEVIAQQDSWPADELLPTSQWRVDDYVQDRHTLTLPSEMPPGEYQLAAVVYDSETQAVLAGPVTFASFER